MSGKAQISPIMISNATTNGAALDVGNRAPAANAVDHENVDAEGRGHHGGLDQQHEQLDGGGNIVIALG